MNTAIKSLLTSALCLCVTGLMFSACSLPFEKEQLATQNYSEMIETESFPIKLKIDQQSYIIQSKPRRLAVLSADLVQALGDMGAASLICGVCTDAPADVAVSGAKVCGTVLDAELEQIAAAKPDWVLTSAQMRQSQIDQLSAQGIEVISFAHPQTLDGVKERYRQLFTLCYGSAGSQKAEEFIKTFEQKLAEAISPAAEYGKLTHKKTAIYLARLDATMATGESFEGQLLDLIGVNNLGELGSRWKYPEVEKAELTPEIIFYDKELSAERIINSELYADTPAVQSQQLYAVDFAAVRMQGLPMIDELAGMARAAYPQAYGQ